MPPRTLTLIAPARFVEDDILETAVECAQAHGFDVRISPGCHERENQFAGSDEQRARHFIEEWNQGPSDILWCVRGGYGSGRLLPRLRGRLEQRDKILLGYSDQTYLLAHIARHGLGTALHGPMAIDLGQEGKCAGVELCLERLAAGDLSFLSQGEALQVGQANGPAIVGNLSILARLIGTPDEPCWDGAILVIEDVDEYLYAVDRLFLHLAQSGVLTRIAGLALGGFTGTLDNDLPFGWSVQQIALYHLNRDIPVASGIAVGHGADNQSIVFGAPAQLICDFAGQATLRVVP